MIIVLPPYEVPSRPGVHWLRYSYGHTDISAQKYTTSFLSQSNRIPRQEVSWFKRGFIRIHFERHVAACQMARE